MNIIFILLCCFIGFNIIKKTGIRRAQWLLIGLLFTLVDITIIASPPITSHKLYLICFYISLIKHNEFVKEIKTYPFKKITLILLFLSFIIAFLDDRLNFTSQIQRGFTNILELSSLFIGYSCIKDAKEFNDIYKLIYKSLIIVCLYGLATWIIKSNPYYDIVTSIFRNDGHGIWSGVQDRGYRVGSTFGNPIVYGFIMGIYFTMFFYFKDNKISHIPVLFLGLILSNIIFSNSRSNLVTLALTIAIYLILKYRFSSKLFLYLSSSILLIIVSYIFLEPVQKIFDSVFDIYLTGGINTNGSTIELKEQQQEFAYLFFLQAPWFGNGFDYFGEVIQQGKISFYNGELAGMEGYGYKLLVEQGAFMIIANLIYMIQIISFCIKKLNSTITMITLANFISFIFFIMLAGTYGGIMYLSLIPIGINIKLMQIRSNKYSHHKQLKSH